VALSNNPGVRKAYEAGTNTDAKGREWRRGLDGWFLDNIDGKGGMMLTYHHLMAELIEKENPNAT
jgi:hypothetical protein